MAMIVEVMFRDDEELSERIIFPITDAQANGIEDARFVEFNDGARKTFYATYTAYSGRAIRSELIETTDFRSFRMTPLGGSAARNKGMALFPRKIDGRYAMIGRQDNENLYLIYSDDLYTWDGGHSILQPRVSLGIRSDRQLRFTHRAGRLLVAADARSWSGQKIFDRGGSAWIKRIRQRFSPARASRLSARAHRTRRLRAECRLYLRRNASRRPDHLALRRYPILLQFRDDKDCRA